MRSGPWIETPRRRADDGSAPKRGANTQNYEETRPLAKLRRVMPSQPRGALRRWRVACAFLAIGTFTVILGYYVPLHREARRLRVERATLETQRTALSRELEQSRRDLLAARAQNTQLMADLAAKQTVVLEVKQRIERLKELLSAQFGRLSQAKMLIVSSAGDRVSVAIAMEVLFPERRPDVTKNGRNLLCQLSKAIMAEFNGQIRVTGYYGKPRIVDPELAQRYATPWELSAARAASAVDVLAGECGGPTDRFLAVGYGPRAAGPLGENVAMEFIFRADD